MKFDLQQFYTVKYAKWIIIAVISLLSVLIISTYGNLLFYPLTPALPSADKDKGALSKNQDATQYILSSSLFGVYVPKNLDEGSVKKSMLNVTLVGILYADKVEESQVIIGSANGEEKTYKIGDSIPGGAKIEKITAGGVLVEHNGNLESLTLPKSKLTFDPVAKPLKEE